MLIRPARQAHGPQQESVGKRTRNGDAPHSILITEMNEYYRPGDGTWMSYREENGSGGIWPFVIERLLAPVLRPDMVEVEGRYLYNGAYIHQHLCNGYTKLKLPASDPSVFVRAAVTTSLYMSM